MSGCGCCACLSAGPHLGVANRPGLEALRYRIGTHGDFLDAMIRRLTIPANGAIDPYSLHALTTLDEFEDLKQNSAEMALDWLAAGIRPEETIMFVQSHVPQVTELHTILSMFTPLGKLTASRSFGRRHCVPVSIHFTISVIVPLLAPVST